MRMECENDLRMIALRRQQAEADKKAAEEQRTQSLLNMASAFYPQYAEA